jgi:hypothetical protein
MAFNPNIPGYSTQGKSFSRTAAFPLESYEIWTDYDALVAYAANTDPNKDPSYIGQKVAYVDFENNKVTHYGIEIDGTLKELGAAPIGDEKSIVIGENNTISLKGIDALVFERDIIGEDGEPTGAKEEVKYQPLMTKNGLVWIEPSKTTIEGLATLINDLTVRVKALEDNRVTEEELAAAVKVVADKVGVPAEGDESTATLYERIAAEILRATQAEEALGARIGVAKDGETAATGVYAYVDGVVNALVNGVDPEKIDSLNELIAWVEAHPDIVSGLDERLDKVEGVLEGFGDTDEPATVKGYIDAHALVADGKYATKQEITDAGYAIATDVARDYATKKELADHNTTVEAKYATKEALKATDDVAKDAQNRVDIVEGKIDEITSVGGEPNVIEKIKVNGVTLEVEKDTEGKSTKTVNIAVPTSIVGMEGYSALDTRVTENTNNIAALEGQLGTTNTNVSGLTTRLAALEAEVGEAAESRIDALEGAVAQHTIDIGTNTAAITTFNTITIPALQQAITDGDKAINDKIGTVKEGETVVDMINAVADKIDFTPYATNARVDTIYKAAEGETPASGILATAVNNLASLGQSFIFLRTDVDTLIGDVEGDGDKSVREIAAEETAAIVAGADTKYDTLKEIADFIMNDETGAAAMANDIAALKTKVNIGDTTITDYVANAIESAAYQLPAATLDNYGGVKLSEEVGTNEEGQLEVKSLSTDKLVQGNMELVFNGGNATGRANA